MKLLVENGADVNLSTDDDHSVLMYVVINNQERIVEPLIKNGVIEGDIETMNALLEQKIVKVTE